MRSLSSHCLLSFTVSLCSSEKDKTAAISSSASRPASRVSTHSPGDHVYILLHKNEGSNSRSALEVRLVSYFLITSGSFYSFPCRVEARTFLTSSDTLSSARTRYNKLHTFHSHSCSLEDIRRETTNIRDSLPLLFTISNKTPTTCILEPRSLPTRDSPVTTDLGSC